MRDIFDGNVPDTDERLNLGAGRGREIGNRPDYDPRVPKTRQQARAESQTMTVGGFGERNERVKSLAATAISFGPFQGRIYEGAGAFKGFRLGCDYDGVSSAVACAIHSGSLNGPILASLVVNPKDTSLCQDALSLGDFGVNFDSLYVEIYLNSAHGTFNASDLPSLNGTVYVASVE